MLRRWRDTSMGQIHSDHESPHAAKPNGMRDSTAQHVVDGGIPHQLASHLARTSVQSVTRGVGGASSKTGGSRMPGCCCC